MNLLALMFTPNGRIGQRDYWIGVAIIIAVVVLVSRIADDIGGILLLSTVYLGICVNGKRLHDIGKSAWGILVPFALLVIAPIGTTIYEDVVKLFGDRLKLSSNGVPSLFIFLFLASSLANLAWVIWLGTRKSQLGDNKYGPGVGLSDPTAFD